MSMLLKLLWELWRGNLCGIEKSKSLRFSITHSYSTSVPMFMFPFLPLPAASNISSVIPLSSYTDVLYSAKIKEKRKKKQPPSVLPFVPSPSSRISLKYLPDKTKAFSTG